MDKDEIKSKIIDEKVAIKEELADLTHFANSWIYQHSQQHLGDVYNDLFKKSLDSKLSNDERVQALEQMKGVAVAMNVFINMIEDRKELLSESEA